MRSIVALFLFLAPSVHAQDLLSEIYASMKEEVYATQYHDITQDLTPVWLEELHTDSLIVQTPIYSQFDFWQEDSTGRKVGIWISYIPQHQLIVFNGVNSAFPTLVSEFHYKSKNKVILLIHDRDRKVRRKLKRTDAPQSSGIPSVIELMF